MESLSDTEMVKMLLMVQATPEWMNWLFHAKQNKLILFFNLKRSGSEHKIHQWWLFTCLTLFRLQT